MHAFFPSISNFIKAAVLWRHFCPTYRTVGMIVPTTGMSVNDVNMDLNKEEQVESRKFHPKQNIQMACQCTPLKWYTGIMYKLGCREEQTEKLKGCKHDEMQKAAHSCRIYHWHKQTHTLLLSTSIYCPSVTCTAFMPTDGMWASLLLRPADAKQASARGRVAVPIVFVKQIKCIGDSSPALHTATTYGSPVQNKEICIH